MATAKNQKGRPKDPAKRDQILDAASDLFLARGLKGASMDAVAKEAGVSKQTLYSHFENKDTLYSAVIAWKSGQYSFAEDTPLPAGPMEEALQTIGVQFLKLVMDPKVISMFRIVIGEASSHNRISHLFYEGGPAVVKAWLSRFFEARSVPDPYFKAVIFTSMLCSDWQMKSMMGLHEDPSDAEIEDLTGRVVSLFMAMLSSDSASQKK